MRVRRVTLAVATASSLLALPPPVSATFPGSAGRILYTNGGHVFAVEPNGTNREQLTFGDVYDWAPVASPDGRRIAFIRDRTGRRDPPDGALFVMEAAGTDARALTGDDEVFARRVSWSPSGTHIAYSSRCPDGGVICVLDVSTGNRHAVTSPANCPPQPGVPGGGTNKTFDSSPSWSPDGDHIAFSRGGCPENPSIARVNADGSGLRTLVPDGGHPDWAPGGGRLVFEAGDGHGVYTVAADGGGRTTVVAPSSQGLDGLATWSPDGDRIAFRSVSGPSAQDITQDIKLVKPDGSDMTSVGVNPGLTDPISWAPLLQAVWSAPATEPLRAVIESGQPVEASCTSACTITSTLFAPAAVVSTARLIPVGKATKKLRRAREIRFRVPLTARAKAAFRKRSRVRVVLKTRIEPRRGPATVRRQRITLKR